MDVRQLFFDELAEGRREAPHFGAQKPNLDVDIGFAKPPDSSPGHQRERVLHSDDDLSQPGRDDRVDAGWGLPKMTTRFKRDKQRRAAGLRTGSDNRVDFGMRPAVPLMPALAHKPQLVVDD